MIFFRGKINFYRERYENFSQENIDYTKSVTGVAYSKDDAKIRNRC